METEQKKVPRKFYVKEFKVVILNEDPGTELHLGDLEDLVTNGPCVLHTFTCEEKEVTSKEMAALLYGAGSDPGFFQLNDAGEDCEL